jgi:hypothetical protein
VCSVCYWEDDGSDNHCLDDDSHCNGLTLRQARANYVRTGVCDGTSTRYVRPPTIVEIQLRRFDDRGEEITPKGSA